MVCGTIMRHILRQPTVTLDLIFGACSVYFLIALLWAFGYSALHVMSDGTALSFPKEARPQDPTRFHELFYYTLVTITTLGYGDILPKGELARSLAALEAFTGQLFVAITIAYLVGLAISTTRASNGYSSEKSL